MLDANELDAIREDAEDFLPSEAIVLVFSETSDGAGGHREAYVPQAPVPCRLSPIGGGETGKPGGRVSERTTHVLSLEHGTMIGEADRVEVVGVGVFEVTLVRKRPELEGLRRVEVREV